MVHSANYRGFGVMEFDPPILSISNPVSCASLHTVSVLILKHGVSSSIYVIRHVTSRQVVIE